MSFLLCLASLTASGCGNNNGGGLDSLAVDSAFAQTGGTTALSNGAAVVEIKGIFRSSFITDFIFHSSVA